MSDLISRKYAIDTLKRYEEQCWEDMCFKPLMSDARVIIGDLPSTEPEIIRCKDCKHRDPEDYKCDCGHDILWQLPRDDDWYCANAERRCKKWEHSETSQE